MVASDWVVGKMEACDWVMLRGTFPSNRLDLSGVSGVIKLRSYGCILLTSHF